MSVHGAIGVFGRRAQAGSSDELGGDVETRIYKDFLQRPRSLDLGVCPEAP